MVMRSFKTLLGLATTAVAIAAANPATAHDGVARFIPMPCWFGFVAGDRIECGYVEVPENWKDPANSRSVFLQVVRFDAEIDNPAADPVIYIEGGPGGESFTGNVNFDPIDSWLNLSMDIRANRDFIVFDQRGIGRSQPSLNCPELHDWPETGAETYSRQDWLDFEQERLTACFDRIMAADVVPDHYDTWQTAMDVDGIIGALGYDQANLWGVSYGTRVALEVLRQRPQRVRQVVLDGVYPVDRQLIADEPAEVERVASEMIALCEQDRICYGAYPDLDGDLREVLAALEKDPVAVDYGPESDAFVLDAAWLLNTLRIAFQHPDDLKRIPMVVNQAIRGNYRPLADMGREAGGEDTESEGRFFATQCRENTPFIDMTALEASMADHYPYGIGALEAPSLSHCAVMDVTPVEASFTEPVSSDKPVLLLSGLFDATTPPSWAAHAAETLSNARHYVMADGGHGVSVNNDCARDIMHIWLEDSVSFAEPACLSRPADILFDVIDSDF